MLHNDLKKYRDEQTCEVAFSCANDMTFELAGRIAQSFVKSVSIM